ncbi:beta-galactosidase [Lactovum odontotermitis]
MTKNTFEIRNNKFFLNNQEFKLISGAIHYFRLPAESWRHSLYNLKAMGANTVETYIPWNLHEPLEGKYNFAGNLDVRKFVKTAERMGLFVILRPSPYICAEWEFGGLPAWLLNDRNMRIRSSDPKFIRKVANYYQRLFKEIAPLQMTEAGPVLMMQLENEYGSYGNDKKYLEAVYSLMLKNGCTVPIFTADGEWKAAQRAGNLVNKDVLPTGNFGSNAPENFQKMQDFYAQDFPLVCMEFWDGWFNRYGEKIIRRDPVELAESFKEALTAGSGVNLYMFHGGTNYGFMNGCSSRGKTDLPQITSYDYDAPLDEAGNPTQKFYELQRVIHELYPEIEQWEPLIKSFMTRELTLTDKVSYFNTKDKISEIRTNAHPLTMEELGHSYGYVLYENDYLRDGSEEKFRIIDASDRVQFYLNEEFICTQYQEEIGAEIKTEIKSEMNKVSILVENMGRVNYGARLLADSQRKGIRSGLMSDIHYMTGNWRHYSLLDEKLSKADFSQGWQTNVPALYKFNFELNMDFEDCYVDMTGFGKGFVTVNGKNIGRYWEKGPVLSLYLSRSFLHEGENEIIVFETEGRFSEKLSLTDHPVYLDEDN